MGKARKAIDSKLFGFDASEIKTPPLFFRGWKYCRVGQGPVLRIVEGSEYYDRGNDTHYCIGIGAWLYNDEPHVGVSVIRSKNEDGTITPTRLDTDKECAEARRSFNESRPGDARLSAYYRGGYKVRGATYDESGYLSTVDSQDIVTIVAAEFRTIHRVLFDLEIFSGGAEDVDGNMTYTVCAGTRKYPLNCYCSKNSTYKFARYDCDAGGPEFWKKVVRDMGPGVIVGRGLSEVVPRQ